jgi:uncharacterized membrane protein
MEKIIDRVKDILLTPKDAWNVIRTEEENQVSIIKNYLLILSAIPAVASFIGQALVGTTIPLVGHYRIPFFSGLIWAVLSFILTIVGVYVSALVINALAPNFGGVKNDVAAFKLVAYSYTAPLVAGILNIIPTLSVLGLLASLYGVYLLYLGLPVLMENPKEKSVSYTVVSILVMIVVYFVMGGIAALALGSQGAHY